MTGSLHVKKEHYLAGGTSFGPFVSRNITPDVNGLPRRINLERVLPGDEEGH